ncbi:MAG: helix-turn-helix transcriptional regulator [Patescibacteria group bacterium]|nr:helix-turn-helix transcriptional regulator [Patescibacteria group bacterium]
MPRTWNTTHEALTAKLVEDGKTYRELTAATGVPWPSIIRFLNDRGGLTGATIDKLMEHYGLTIVEPPTKRRAKTTTKKGRQ